MSITQNYGQSVRPAVKLRWVLLNYVLQGNLVYIPVQVR
ncbi:MAG: hypothetical protein ACJAWT_000655 [Glaciecola sp.]|jgi:hypothetical protein